MYAFDNMKIISIKGFKDDLKFNVGAIISLRATNYYCRRIRFERLMMYKHKETYLKP